MALVVLELAVMGAAGTLVLASRALGRAERLERAVATAEGVIDSLARAPLTGAGRKSFSGGEVRWSLDDSARLSLRALGPEGTALFDVEAVLPP